MARRLQQRPTQRHTFEPRHGAFTIVDAKAQFGCGHALVGSSAGSEETPPAELQPDDTAPQVDGGETDFGVWNIPTR